LELLTVSLGVVCFGDLALLPVFKQGLGRGFNISVREVGLYSRPYLLEGGLNSGDVNVLGILPQVVIRSLDGTIGS
jgi:hypothetical protein